MRLGVVGGSSLVKLEDEHLDAFKSIGMKVIQNEEISVETEYGEVSLHIVGLESAPCYPVLDRGIQHTIVFVQRHRHKDGGMMPPHMINHRANIKALADQKVDRIVATTSVGAIVSSFPPGRVGIARQYIDFTGVPMTFHENSAKFTSVTQPFSSELNKELEATLRRVQGLRPEVRLAYTCWLSAGPQYETEAEVTAVERLGGEVCGFTMPREAKLCAELGIPYAALLVATNWAAGRHPGDHTKALSHEELTQCAAERAGVILSCLVDLVKGAGHSASSQFGSATKRKGAEADAWSDFYIKKARESRDEPATVQAVA